MCPENAMLLCRLPIYGTMDAGRGFYNRLCTEAKTEGLEVSNEQDRTRLVLPGWVGRFAGHYPRDSCG